ncbi:galactose mutarotase-like protein [Annulohypoxylon maeteangense]|uniref:galactose mutarotase-like protein n=1 Tax=Annulohypoxylon maeteangense TaxID=1927788 RepID=UPI0020085647|nr:galactose mutarotase-like protein [Annulohypoxylon maeteangense]KAI0880062.1 galactose mutarotase-like protein [Annulohypoxylon maeteangense]
MVDRRNRPTALATTPGLPPQPQVNFSHENSRVTAVLPAGESVEVLLYGATVISWKNRFGIEKLWLSDAAKLDGSKAVRGGIPLVFPVFGTAPDHAATSKLPQHGFARNSRWEFLGKSSSESASPSDISVKLDFGLSSATLDDQVKSLWPYTFSIIYSVTLTPENLSTSIVVTNDGNQPIEFQTLMHTYLRVEDISKIQVTGLEESDYVDKVDAAKEKKQSGAVTIAGEVDRVYSPAKGPSSPVVVTEDGETVFSIVRDNLKDVVVWNPWTDKAAGMGDFEPKDGFKNMICIEAGSVKGWITLDPSDAFEGAQTISD